jgi:hypothetical protein
MFAYLLKRKQANNVLNRHKSNVHFMFANKHTYNLVILFTNQLDFFPDNSSLGEIRQHLDARKDLKLPEARLCFRCPVCQENPAEDFAILPLSDSYRQALAGDIAFTMPFNLSGNPAMSMPLHWWGCSS